MQPAIADYGFLSDCHSAALVDRRGSIDWWCVPRFDSPSVFGRLLDPRAGHWTLRPAGEFTSSRGYVEDTLILETVFGTDTGDVRVTESLLLEPSSGGHDVGMRSPHVLNRRVQGLTGSVSILMEFAPRMEYGRTEPHLRLITGGAEARGGPVTLTLRCHAPITIDDGMVRAEFVVRAGEVMDIEVGYAPTFASVADVAAPLPSLEQTLDSWTSWTAEHTTYEGPFAAQVSRSSLVLQGLTYAPSGAIVAAATTSLPETMGGELNFDYRYAWLRDLALTVRALWFAACPSEPARLFDWLANSAGHTRTELVQIMYGVEGERDLSEHVLEHLEGYRSSAPVRVGNEAWKQSQLDVFGEVLDAAHLLRDQLGDLTQSVQQLLVTLANRAVSMWMEPDAGMWEARDKRRHYTSSKVMCWVALDRAVALASRLGDQADPQTWCKARDAVRDAVLEQAWSEKVGAYTGAFGSDELDSSVLLLPVVGFLPAYDERMLATIRAIQKGLGQNGLVRRWQSDRSGFLICTYWLVECLALAGLQEEASTWFDSATAHANDLGLLAEEADPTTGDMLGNYPQAFSHVGLINAAWRLGQSSADSG